MLREMVLYVDQINFITMDQKAKLMSFDNLEKALDLKYMSFIA